MPDGGVAGPDRLAARLAGSRNWPSTSEPVEWIQTHISHVFLAGERVYKLRKAVAFPFLDFTTLAARNADCLQEVALNRRLAPSVYLGVAPIQQEGETVSIGPVGEALSAAGLEHVTVMRRLPADRNAQALLERGALRPSHLEAVAERLRVFHAENELGRPAPWSPYRWLDRVAKPVRDCMKPLADSGLFADARILKVTESLERRLATLGPVFEERRRGGFAVEGHGDLHLDHIWFEPDGEVLLIDCLEFNEALRRIDRASEVAFLAMDLRYRGRLDLAECFLASYAAATDDYGIFPVVDFYAAYRALVRAKVAALATRQDAIDPAQRRAAGTSAERHLDLAESLLEPPGRGSLVVMCGTVGSGKSTVARSLAESGEGVPIASDRVRKRLAGVGPTVRVGAGVDQGLYDPKRTRQVYLALLQRAGAVVDAGRTAILDATFSWRAERDRARRWAARRGVPARLIEVRCAPERARARLAARERAGRDVSDAGPDLLAASQARFEPPSEWPEQDRRVHRSDRDDPDGSGLSASQV